MRSPRKQIKKWNLDTPIHSEHFRLFTPPDYKLKFEDSEFIVPQRYASLSRCGTRFNEVWKDRPARIDRPITRANTPRRRGERLYGKYIYPKSPKPTSNTLPTWLQKLTEDVLSEQEIKVFFESSKWSVLLNYYEDGKDYIPWHSDANVDPNFPVVSCTFYEPGADAKHMRTFKFRALEEGSDYQNVYFCLLNSGMVVRMTGQFQHRFEHTVDEVKKGVVAKRLNITWRIHL